MKYKKLLFTSLTILIICLACIFNVLAHPGRTDGSGGHRDNNNSSGLGSYHYHCGGYPAHLHTGGVCPYTGGGSYSSGYSSSSDKYNEGYDDGYSDGYDEGDSIAAAEYEASYEQGYSDGYSDGYNEDYDEHLDDLEEIEGLHVTIEKKSSTIFGLLTIITSYLFYKGVKLMRNK